MKSNQVNEPLYGVSNTEAFERARHYSRYAHKNWMVWKSEAGWNAAEVSVDAINKAVADVGPDGRIDQVAGASPRYLRVGAACALAWKANLEAGHYVHC